MVRRRVHRFNVSTFAGCFAFRPRPDAAFLFSHEWPAAALCAYLALRRGHSLVDGLAAASITLNVGGVVGEQPLGISRAPTRLPQPCSVKPSSDNSAPLEEDGFVVLSRELLCVV